jgi:hypothetical protein
VFQIQTRQQGWFAINFTDANPRLARSGMQRRWQAGGLLDGFRPGTIVRLDKNG